MNIMASDFGEKLAAIQIKITSQKKSLLRKAFSAFGGTSGEIEN